jgi:lipopolysaccharide export system permease protein
MIVNVNTYLIRLFLKKIINISLIFFLLIFILSLFEEISFFKDLDISPLFPFFVTALNAPSTLFQIFPFIFLISSQFFFLELINSSELETLKTNGFNNFKIIRVLFFTSFFLGIILVLFYYTFSSKLKFIYLDLKNNYTNDNKYLAVVTKNGLWIKDEIDEKIYIIQANKIEDIYLKDVSIFEFNDRFELNRSIDSKKIDISNFDWIIFNPIIFKENNKIQLDKNLQIRFHFNRTKIGALFSNLSSLNLIQLLKLNIDYKSLGYSTIEVDSHMNKLYSLPIFTSIMTLLASIIMLNIKRSKPILFHIILGIFLSVTIYYFYYLFNILGINGKVPLITSIWLPLFILSIFILIGLVRINEK